ncbi:hypothetical protein SS50377_26358 [Spironucleus salmonicida]|uniref:Uncharacterized protein n=1 Tax=Spironucleus salmonicida TaxID=348837 RepID=V6LT71_9EUKA|nr:hypothetical protein SS50377_26358 [Spironucleus salmonicida]|eukprot:EST47775.1 Hypothetical protein SS50377_12174 [Spironucleus salmonicida]
MTDIIDVFGRTVKNYDLLKKLFDIKYSINPKYFQKQYIQNILNSDLDDEDSYYKQNIYNDQELNEMIIKEFMEQYHGSK